MKIDKYNEFWKADYELMGKYYPNLSSEENAHSGGIFAAINPDTGIVLSAISSDAVIYEKHPDTNIKFNGYKIPLWDEVCKVAKDIARFDN